MKVKVTHSTKYLGKVVHSDGKNTDNISQRKKRGFGTITDIVNILDTMCLGPLMFNKAVVLRNSMLVGTLLTCSEAWYNVTEVDMVQLEQLDKGLWSQLLEVARTTLRPGVPRAGARTSPICHYEEEAALSTGHP